MKTRTYRSRAVDRAVDVVQAIGCNPDGIGLAALGRETGIPLGTLVSILGTLEDRTIVHQLPTRGYVLDAGILQLSLPYTESLGLGARFHEVASRLVETFNETVQLGVLAGPEVVYVARVESSEPVRLAARIGRRVAAHASATGKALLAGLDDGTIRRILGPEPLARLTPQTLTRYRELDSDLTRVRSTGLAEANQECTMGLHCLAARVDVPVGTQAFAIVVSTPTFRMTSPKRASMARAIVAAAAELSGTADSRSRARA